MQFKAQSQTGYNYPSPFNPLTPGSSSNDLGGSPGSSAQQPQQSTPYAGSQSGYNNQQFSPSGNIDHHLELRERLSICDEYYDGYVKCDKNDYDIFYWNKKVN